MKKYLLLLSFFILFASACTRNCEEKMDCSGDCLFMEVDKVATVGYFSCFDTWGVQYSDPSSDPETIFCLSTDFPKNLKEEGLTVTFSGTFFENSIPLQFPDPSMFGLMYEVDFCDIEE